MFVKLMQLATAEKLVSSTIMTWLSSIHSSCKVQFQSSFKELMVYVSRAAPQSAGGRRLCGSCLLFGGLAGKGVSE